MAWEKRRNGRFYYRSYRDPATGQVRKQYIGTGPAAEEAARQDVAQRARSPHGVVIKRMLHGVSRPVTACCSRWRGSRRHRQGRAGGGRLLPTPPRRMEAETCQTRKLEKEDSERKIGGKEAWNANLR